MGVILYIGLNCMMVTSFSDPRTVQGGYMVQFIVCVLIMCVHSVLLMSSHKALSVFFVFMFISTTTLELMRRYLYHIHLTVRFSNNNSGTRVVP